jgi:hypothetical protein
MPIEGAVTGTFGDYSESNSNASAEPSDYEICQASGFKFPAGVLVKQWDGLMVHPRFLDHRHPQEFVRGRPERPRPSRSPEVTDEFLVTSYILTTEDGALLELEDATELDGYLLTEEGNQVSVGSL